MKMREKDVMRAEILNGYTSTQETEKQCHIIGIQFPIESGISSKDVILAMSRINCDTYDFYRVDGNGSSAYFVFDSDIFNKFLEHNFFPSFETYIGEILDDLNQESKSGYYQFEGYDFWLGCRVIPENSVNFLIRERNVDGCGGNAEVSVWFPTGLSVEEITEFEEILTTIKQNGIESGEDFSTDDVIKSALSFMEYRYEKIYYDGAITVIEF